MLLNLYDDKMHVFGGYDGGRLDTSEFVSLNGSYAGSKLPTGVQAHAITVLNKTYLQSSMKLFLFF